MSRHVPDFANENEQQRWVAKQFKKHGWNVKREVSPVDSDYRADLLTSHDTWGAVGIECKYMKSPRCGSKFGQAIKQIVGKYRGRKYHVSGLGYDVVDKWVLCPYFYHDTDTHGVIQSLREVLCRFGIGLALPREEMKLDFAYSSSETKISISDHDGEYYGDKERIESLVNKKKGLLDERPTEEKCQYTGCSAIADDTATFQNKFELKLCRHHIDEFDRYSHKIDPSRQNSIAGADGRR